MSIRERQLFIGIDLGWENRKTSGVCILEKKNNGLFPLDAWCRSCEDFWGREILTRIKPLLKETKAIAIDAPLTKGRGKGKMRLYEKFLSTKTFRNEKTNPLPPALMPELCNFALKLRRKLEKERFILNSTLIETFPTMVNKIGNKDFFSQAKGLECKNENQKSALICTILAYLHFSSRTRYLGYKDGLLFLPEFSFWKKEWQEKFYLLWNEKPYLRYRRLISNLFENN